MKLRSMAESFAGVEKGPLLSEKISGPYYGMTRIYLATGLNKNAIHLSTK